MKKPSFRPSPAMIVACVSLFVALGGTGLAATYVVSSNSQIGPNTVSGHKPLSGDHSNIIGGTVNGQDLANAAVSNAKLANGSVSGGKLAGNSVTSAKVLDGSLTGNDLALNNVSSALGVRTGYGETVCATTCGSPTTLYTQGPWTLIGSCINDTPGAFHAKIEVSSSADAIIAVNDGVGQRVPTGTPTTIAQTGTVSIPSADTSSKGGELSALLASANFNNHISGHVLAVADGGANDGGGLSGFCKFAFEGLGQ